MEGGQQTWKNKEFSLKPLNFIIVLQMTAYDIISQENGLENHRK